MNQNSNTDTNPESKPEVPKDKRRKKRLLITLGVVIVIIATAGTAGIIWHNQPGFCSTICHSTMSPYYEGYVSADKSLLVTAHAEADTVCLDCHDASLGEQVSEIIVQVSGNYEAPLSFRQIGTREMCLDCHDSYDALADSTSDFDPKRNPHSSHEGMLECYDCHRVHQQSVLQCSECHGDMNVPDGWLTHRDVILKEKEQK